MQIYRGLDIITNKATTEEMQGVPHHLLGFLDPAEKSGKGYDVKRFVEDTNKIAERLAEEGKLPIVAGGTTYYLQHLMFPGRLISTSPADSRVEEKVDLTNDRAYQSLTEEERELLGQVGVGNDAKADLAARAAADQTLAIKLWKLLEKIDPVMAGRWHYRDSRKVANSLRVYKETARQHSFWISQQDQHSSTKITSPAPSAGISGYRKLLFWLWCDPATLRQRLDDRVDEMVARGLQKQVREMREIARSMLNDTLSKGEGKYQTGIFQTIGYRQFAEYLDKLEALTEEAEVLEKEKQQWFNEAVEGTKTSTRQYAKSQLKWVQNKLIPEVRRAQAALSSTSSTDDVQLYLLDTTDPSLWSQNVLNPAVEILSRFLDHQPLPDPTTISNPTAATNYLYSGRTPNQALSKLSLTSSPAEESGGEGVRTIEANKLFTCEICTFDPQHPVLVREVDTETHRKGRHHRNNVKRKMSGEEKEKRIQEKIEDGESKRILRQQLRAEGGGWRSGGVEKNE